LSDCPHSGKDEAIVLLSNYTRKRDADKKKANFKTLGNNRATADNRDGQTTSLTAENLGVKVTVLEDTGSDYSAIPRSVERRKEAWLPSQGRGVAGAHHAKHGFQGRKRQAELQCDRDAHGRGDYHHAIGAYVHAWSATDHCRRGYGPFTDRKAGFRRDRFRGESASVLCTGQFHLHDSHTGEELLGMNKKTSGALSKLQLMPADIPEFIADLPDVLTLAKTKT
jgi:hypothetical protein